MARNMLKNYGRFELLELIYNMRKENLELKERCAEAEKQVLDIRTQAEKQLDNARRDYESRIAELRMQGAAKDLQIRMKKIEEQLRMIQRLTSADIDLSEMPTEDEIEELVAQEAREREEQFNRDRENAEKAAAEKKANYDEDTEMARKPKDASVLPELNEIESEMSQVRSKGRYRQALKGTFGTFVVIAAIAVIIAFIFLPVLRITNGHNMEPGLQPGDMVILLKTPDVKTGQVAAFKILHRDDDAARTRFALEIRLLFENHGPFLPAFYGAGKYRGRPWCAMELLEPFPLPSRDAAVASFVTDVCRAAAALHARGYVHRDIKPSNVLSRSGVPVLIDLGLAKATGGPAVPLGPAPSIVDGHAVGVGTPG